MFKSETAVFYPRMHGDQIGHRAIVDAPRMLAALLIINNRDRDEVIITFQLRQWHQIIMPIVDDIIFDPEYFKL